MQQNHPNIIRRLRRAEGHLQTIISMIEKGRPCLELAQQLQAIENAIDNAKKALIHDHIDRCVGLSIGARSPKGEAAALREFRSITKYL